MILHYTDSITFTSETLHLHSSISKMSSVQCLVQYCNVCFVVLNKIIQIQFKYRIKHNIGKDLS